MKELYLKASQAYAQNFTPVTWYGRCLFLSWYCDLGTCKFCFRSTIKHKIKYAAQAKRSLSSVIVEALLCKHLGWRIEFLTGGYRIFSFEQLKEFVRLVSQAYGEKIWINLGVIKPEDLAELQPYVKGIVSSIETTEPELHKAVCPDKPIEPYEKMFESAPNFKKSITLVIGLGEKKSDFSLLAKFIEKHRLDRITFYALKPVKGTAFEKSNGPKTEDYLWWIALTRIKFPKLEIIAGTTARRYQEVGLLLKAGANAFTKFPATKMFGTQQAYHIEEDIKRTGRQLKGSLTVLPKVNWEQEIENLGLKKELEEEVKGKMKLYLSKMEKNIKEYQNNPDKSYQERGGENEFN